MIMLNANVRFTASGKVDRTFLCDYVVFGLELVGRVDEMLDFSLEEDYEGVRETIKLRVKLDLIGAQFMANFVQQIDKRLIIDGSAYEVVNDFRALDFPLFKNSSVGVHPELRFKCKNLGVVNPVVYTMAQHHEGTLEE